MINSAIQRLWNSTVAWSWAFNFLRLASGLLLLPLLLVVLPDPDFGMYQIFVSLGAIVVVLDLGFSPTLGRFVTYAMGGAKKLTAIGLDDHIPDGDPNYPLLWELLGTAKIFYLLLVLVIAVLLGLGGTYYISRHVSETSSPSMTWGAWVVAIFAIGAETYFNVWNMFLRNMNRVLTATRIYFLTYALRLVLAIIFLLAGGGLLSLPAASLFTSAMVWRLSKSKCIAALSPCPPPAHVKWQEHFKTIWPNSWRLGLYFGGNYLSTYANVLLCGSVFGLEGAATFGLSLQVVTIVTGMAGVWTLVKWPLIGQLIARRSIAVLRQVLWPRLCLQLATYAFLAGVAIAVGPLFLRLLGSGKELLPLTWMALLALNGFLENHCSVWNTLISMWNQLPMLWPTLITQAAGLCLNFVLVQHANAHPGLLVLGPLITNAALNYWYWPRYGARTLNVGWLEFLRCGFVRNRAV